MAGRATTDAIIKGRCAISVNNPGHPLPPGWARVALTDVAELGTGHTPSRLHPEYWDGDVPWIGIRDAGAHHGGTIHQTAQHVTALGLANSAARLLPKDTVCLSRTASVGYVVKLGQPMATSQDFVTWSCSEALDPDYLMHALLAEGQDIRRFGEGSTHTTIYFPKVKAFHIDLPPLAEQRRIVVKLETLTARITSARAELDRVPRMTRRLKASTLSASFQMQSPAWRHVPWKLAGETLNGRAFPSSEYTTPGVKLIRPGNLANDGRVTWTALNTRALPQSWAEQHPSFYMQGEEILINLTAQSLQDEFLGRACLSDKNDRFLLNQRIARFLPNCMTKRYCLYVLKSPYFREFVNNGLNSGSLIQHVHTKMLANFEFPVAPKVEQEKIVEQIDAVFARADRLEAEVARATALLDRLETSILTKAFQGELVPQDPADEPTSVLLDRVRAERTAAPKAKRSRRVVSAASG